jgi:PGF-pre-PGF domain-containing protein
VKQAVVWVVLALLLAASVNAAEDFFISGNQQPSAFRCLPTDGSFTVTNSGDVASAYAAGAEGTAAPWTLGGPLRFVLNPGQSQAVTYTINVPCDASDQATLDWTIATDAGTAKAFSVSPVITTPEDIQLLAGSYDASVMPCQAGHYLITLRNPFAFEERYGIAVTNPSKLALDIVQRQTSATLQGNETASVAVDVTPKDCGQAGDTTLLLRITTQKTQLQADFDLPFVIENKGIAEVGRNVDRIVAGYAPSAASVSILNKGTSTESYAISVTGVGWVQTNTSSVTLAPGQASSIGLVISPTRGAVAQDDYHVAVSATASGTKATYSKDLVVRVYEPSWLTRQFTEHLGRTVLIIIAAIIVIIILLAIIGRIITYLRSEEHARKKERRAKEREARRKAREDARKLRLREKEQERRQREREAEKKKLAKEKRIADEKKAKREKEQERRREEEKRLRAIEKRKRDEELRESKEYFERAKAAAEKELRRSNYLVAKKEEPRSRAWLVWLAIVLLLAAVVIAVLALPYLIAYGMFVIAGIIAVIVLIVIIVIIELWRGRRVRVYRFASLRKKEVTVHTGWRRNVGEVSVRSAEVTGPCKLIVRRSRRPIGFVGNKGAYAYLRLEGRGIDSADIGELGIRFSVPKGWLRRHKVAAETVKLSRYDVSWRGTATEIVGEDKRRVYYSASPDCLGTFAIVGREGSMKMPKPEPKPVVKPAPKPEVKKVVKVVARKEKPKPKKKGKPWPWPLILGILLILLVVGAAWILSTYAPVVNPPTADYNGSGIPPQVWAENTKHQLNLSGWFKDPDNEPLTASWTPVQGVVLTARGLLVTLEPAKEFVGNRTVQFTVSDPKGGKAQSNAVLLLVYATPALTTLQKAGQFCADYFVPIVAGVVILVLLIWLIEYRKQVKKFLEED